MLKLKRFRVTNFRSVRDSGWIETDQVTALIGTNESGKTNLLVPLWKLNPAKDGAIDAIADFPRDKYTSMRGEKDRVTFIQAEFSADTGLRLALSAATSLGIDKFETVVVARRFDGEHVVSFPQAENPRTTPKKELVDYLKEVSVAIQGEKSAKKEASMQASMLAALAQTIAHLESDKGDGADANLLTETRTMLSGVSLTEAAQHSTLTPRWAGMNEKLDDLLETITRPDADEVAGVKDLVVKSLPKFVYYSNYGNLDSEIYLPHVIANMSRQGLGPKEEARARTLRVLFEYVKLSPQEILELGKAAEALANAKPAPEAIEAAAKRTKERGILLRSADTDLTKSFREWWKQGDYRFRFAADGDHFRIWVSDDRRPEEIELEARSTGLQWFFSFFLVFLVERRDAHKGAVLLLDEPGLSLHPLSQRDLSAFFDNLSKTNPIVYTTHSPFMVDQDHVDRVRGVFVDAAGATAVSADLRAASTSTAQGKSVYAVHAALGLSVSEALMQGCSNVIVEGPSDQYYLSAMKTVLVGRRKIAPKRELLFPPGGGAKGVNALVPVVAAKDSDVPIVLLDDDGQGRQFADALRKGPLYSGAKDRVLNVRDFVGFEHAEVEDLLASVVADVASREYRGRDDDFKDVFVSTSPIVPQIEAFAVTNGIALEQGWKVDLARKVKQRLLRDLDKLPDAMLDEWTKLFARFEPSVNA